MAKEIYLDNNATTRPLQGVCAEICSVLGPAYGNPSSAHTAGDRARSCLRRARESVAALVGARPEHITFTSSGTEANNMVLFSAVANSTAKRCRIVTTTIEHSSILKALEFLQSRGVDVLIVPVDCNGVIDIDSLLEAVTSDTCLVSVQHVNNETGVVQPLEKIGALCRSLGVAFHADACQSFGKLPLSIWEQPIDLLTVTAHKIHGPQGVGAVYAQNPNWLTQIFFGGPQENGLRAGTENMPSIVGFGRAADLRHLYFERVTEALRQIRDEFETQVLNAIPDVSVNGGSSPRVCNTTNLCFRGIDGQALTARLDQLGIRCSQSSACNNHRPEPSYVLKAMGLSEEDAYSSVRFSFGEFNTMDEIPIVVAALRELCAQLRIFTTKLRNPYHDLGV